MAIEFGKAVQIDFNSLFLGERLGGGAGRTVYELAIDPTKVVKVEEYAQSFQNVLEWQTWQEVKETKWAGWFAPCLWISPSGSVLIQARTDPAKRFPDKVPAFFTDLKIENFGLLKGRFVAHDYGVNLLMSQGLSDRMRKAPKDDG